MGLSDLSFHIPLHREDLCKAQHQNQIVVEEVYPDKRLTSLLDGLKEKLRTTGPECIGDGFDVLYSVLRHFDKLKSDPKEVSWKIINRVITKLTEKLGQLFSNGQRLEADVRMKYLNMTKMSVYIFCQLIDCFETEATRPSGVAVIEKGRRKGKKSLGDTFWDDNREDGLNVLSQLTKQPLNRLWEPPSLEEEFVNLLNNCCFKILENPSVVKSKAIKDSIMALLGFSFSKVGHTLGLSLKIIQMLQGYEHLVVPLAEIVTFLVRDHGHKNMIPEILRETGRIDSKELSRDSAGTRALSQFLVELSTKIPYTILPSISLLLTFLDGEAYTMRNCVLSIIGEVIWKCLSGENMDSKAKNIREQLLDKLEHHIHDVNAFVRSKALQIWLNLCKEKVIPLSRQHQLLCLVTGRLYDKSSQVRKHSIYFFTAFLQGNPFTAKLSFEDLKESYEKEKAKLQELLPDSQESDYNRESSGSSQSSKLEKWEEIAVEVEKVLEKFEEKEPGTPLLNGDMILADVLKSINKYLEEGQYLTAIQIVVEAKELFQGQPIFELENEQFMSDGMTNGDNGDSLLPLLKKIYSEEVVIPEEGSADNLVNEVSKQQVLVQYLKDCVQFAEQVHESIPAVAHLLSSKTLSDVIEAINFFVTAYEFGVRESLIGVRKMLLLIWSKEATVKEAVVTAYKRLYLNPKPTGDRTVSEEIVHSLLVLLHGLCLGEIASLEELIGEMVRSGDLSKAIYNVLWDLFSMKQEKTTLAESHGAIILLSMVAKAENDVVQKNLDLLITVGLGPRAENDFLFAKDVCLALVKIPGTTNPSVEAKTPPFRLATDHPLFERLSEIIANGFSQNDNPYWAPMAQQAVKVMYKLAEHPERIAESLISQLVLKTVSDTSEGDVNQPESNTYNLHLCRLFCLVGEVALAHLGHLDFNVYTELKRRHYMKEAQQQRKEKKKRHSRRSALGVDSHKVTEADNAIDIEMGLVGAEANDNEADYISEVVENELLRDEGLFKTVCPVLIEVCSNPAKYPDMKLRISASLALAKVMMISSSFCEKHLSLLVTILDKSQEPVIRGNTIIALGDLNIRFPNLVEPWIPHLYARLRDPSEVVRKNTLLVLTHLILNDLIKVKSQISEVALCIVDNDEKVKKMVKTLFTELSRKGNNVYNILPDIISRLSDPECGTEENHFRTILKFLLSFIDKDKQLEGLVEKLCIRFNSTRTERQDRDLAYCLSLIPCNERCIRKLQENVACYAEKLKDETIYECFTVLINGSRKGINLKPEQKTSLDELEKLIEELHLKGVSDENLIQKAKLANPKQKGKPAPRTTGKAVRKRKERFVDSSSDEEEDNLPFKGGRVPASAPAIHRTKDLPKRSKFKPILTFSDSEGEEPVPGKSDAENEEPSQTPVRRSSRKK